MDDDNSRTIKCPQFRLVDQDEIEKFAGRQLEQQLALREFELEQNRLQKIRNSINKIDFQIEILSQSTDSKTSKILREIYDRAQKVKLDDERIRLLQDEKDTNRRISEYKKKIDRAGQDTENEARNASIASDEESLIKKGKITPFHKKEGYKKNREIDFTEGKDKIEEVDEPSSSELLELLKTEELANVDFSIDDGNENVYNQRMKYWISKRVAKNKQKLEIKLEDDLESEIELKEYKPVWEIPHAKYRDVIFEGGFRIPGEINIKLFDYQRICVQWLWELYCQKVGGIMGDEMGLGKTVQVIAFLAALHHSGLIKKPILIVCPATVMGQWILELHKWWPPFRAIIIHSMGSGMGKKIMYSNEAKNSERKYPLRKRVNQLIQKVIKDGHILITTYASLRNYSDTLLNVSWDYCILDEGHKIRNPTADITLTCKQIKTYNRIILSGTPIQNKLEELWSIFDFVYPGRLGTLSIFQTQFAIPINIGGYANASNVQVQTGYQCACILRDLINPYLLRRMKSDVASDLPFKKEQILFCKLTKSQRKSYEGFLRSKEMESILAGRCDILYGIDILRKICNHPDLVHKDVLISKGDKSFGDPCRSGKMQVIKSLLDLWKRLGHKVLLFTQTVQMLNILEKFIENIGGFNFLRMDGMTSISSRHSLITKFNQDEKIDIFLLTTRVGGLGVNLIGADRVIIYDPDWNPSTDMQARERAWRLGQKRDVTIYRLMCSGTIEEKIYHRQIFKQILTNKILHDPNQRRFFKPHDLYDLFSLADQDEQYGTASGEIFPGTEKIYGKYITFKTLKEQEIETENIKKISGLGGIETLSENQATPKETEDYVLENIFSGSNINSALEHDKVLGSKGHIESSATKEAVRIAQLAKKTILSSTRNSDETSSKFILGLLRKRKHTIDKSMN